MGLSVSKLRAGCRCVPASGRDGGSLQRFIGFAQIAGKHCVFPALRNRYFPINFHERFGKFNLPSKPRDGTALTTEAGVALAVTAGSSNNRA